MTVVEHKPRTSVGVRAMEKKKGRPATEVEFDAHLPGRIETDSTGKHILIRDPDASDDTSELEILEYSPPDDSDSNKSGESEMPDEADQYDPYNSGTFDMSKSELAESREWKSKSRK
jgi:hypothetical protein